MPATDPATGCFPVGTRVEVLAGLGSRLEKKRHLNGSMGTVTIKSHSMGFGDVVGLVVKYVGIHRNNTIPLQRLQIPHIFPSQCSGPSQDTMRHGIAAWGALRTDENCQGCAELQALLQWPK